MKTPYQNKQGSKSRSVAHGLSETKSASQIPFHFTDNRQEAVAQSKLTETMVNLSHPIQRMHNGTKSDETFEASHEEHHTWHSENGARASQSGGSASGGNPVTNTISELPKVSDRKKEVTLPKRFIDTINQEMQCSHGYTYTVDVFNSTGNKPMDPGYNFLGPMFPAYRCKGSNHWIYISSDNEVRVWDSKGVPGSPPVLSEWTRVM